MKIYSIDDKELLDVKVTSAAVHEEEMMKSNLVRLSWKSNVKINLAVGTYIIPYEDGLKYRLIEPYEPTQDSEDTFTYQPEFQHPIMWLSKVPFTYATKNTLGEDVVQQEWEYTGLTLNILKYAVDFINTTFGFTDKEKFVLTPLGNIDTNVSLSFSSTDVLSALSAIANGCTENKCEYHLSWEHKALYFGQVSINLEETIPTLKVGENVGKASVTQTKGGYYNVFYPQGSTRNMSVKAASGENVSTGIRLGLDKTKYPNGEIDTRENSNEPKQTLAMTFDEVYPHVNCYVYNVRKRTRYLLDDENKKVVSEYNADGSVKSYKTYTVWYMRLAYPLTKQISGKTPIATTNEKLNGVTQTLYWYDYEVDDKQIIDGYTLCGSFSVNTNEGALGSTLVAQPSNGDGFELKYHKIAETIPANATSGDSGVTILKGDYEIVFVNQNDTVIPTNENEGLIPRGEKTPSVKGNIVILYNIAMGDDEVTAAQDELERKTLAEIAYRHSDLNNYAFTAYPNVFAKNNPHLYIGQRVNYDDGNGYSYTTRVLKLTTNLDYDICQEITVGNSTIKGVQTQLKEDVQGLISGTISVGSCLSYEQVLTICKNYVSKRYLRKDQDDETQYTLKMGGAVVNGVAKIKDRAKSDDFDNQAGFPFGKGWAAVKNDGSGASMLEVDKLFVRMKAYFAELEIRKISYLGGNYVFSSAGGKIYYVEWLDAKGKILEQTEANKSLVYTFRCYLYSDDGTTQTMNWFKVDDQVRCQNFGDLSKDAKAANGVITDTDHTTHYWWRRVNAVGNGVIAAKGDNKAYQYIDFQNTVGQYGTDSDFPEIGDAMVQFGNWTTASRQGVIMIVVTGDDAPAIIEWQDVGANGKHFTMPENEYTRLSPRGDGNIIRGKFISVSGTTTDHTGESLDEQINALVDQLNDIKNQADKKFDIWFNGGEPHPNSATDTQANLPASDWTTEAEKALHTQDLYYDTDKAPASQGGRAWRWMAHYTNSSVSYYWDDVTDKDTIDALEKAADLQNQVDDIVSDGIISHGSEKSSLLMEWNTACSNYNKYNEQVIDYSLQDEDVWKNFSKAFFGVATMLNNGADYTYPNVPVWISSDGITKDTALADTPCHDAAEYRAKWNAYYESLAALLAAITKKAKELADAAQNTADEQMGRIDDIVSDGKLDPSEKITIKREFLAFYHELYDDKGLEDKGKNEDGDFYTDEINNSFNSVVNSLGAVGTMLNNAVDWPVPNPSLIDKKLPIWLQNPPLPISATDKNEYITDTSSIDADTFRSKWSAMYAAKSAYISLLSEYAKSLADNAQTTANGKANVFVSDSVPSQPYKRGDLWIQTANGNNVMICTVTRTGTDSGVLSDWADLSDTYDFKGIRTLLATLAEKIYDISGGYIESRGKIRVYFNKDGMEVANGNIRYDNNSVKRCYLSTWETIDNSSYDDAFACVYGVLGSCMLTVYSSKPSSASKYDLVIRKVNWHDPFKNEDVEGNIEILMYNGTSWEMLRESTKAIIENLGDEIRTVVFGSDGTGATDASGLITKTMFNNLFSEKVKLDSDGNVINVNKAGVVTTTDFNTWKNGELKEQFDDKLDVSAFAGLYAKAVEADGTIVKTASMGVYVTKDGNNYISNAKVKADNIELEGLVTANKYFKVLEDGSIEAANANISGTINATSGKIAGFFISGNGLVNTGFNNDAYVIFRNDTYNTFAGIGGNVLPASSGMRAVARFENHDKTDQWGLGHNVAVIMSAKNSDYNLAFAGNGNGFLAGYIAGYGFQEKTCDKENTCFILHPKESLLFIVDVTKQKASIGLPSLFEIRMMLGIGANEEFAVPIEIIIKTCPGDSYGGTFIYGKNKNIDGMNTDNYPTTDWTQSWTYGQAGSYINDSFFRAGYNKFILSYRNSKYSAYAAVSSYYSYYADNS